MDHGGTHLGELFGLALTGARVTMPGMDSERFVDGKISSSATRTGTPWACFANWELFDAGRERGGRGAAFSRGDRSSPRATLDEVPTVAVLLALPAAGLVLLLAAPGTDAHLEHQPTHFWLVLGTALVNVVLGLAASEAARRRGDARASLVSLAFLSSAGFLALHALATPGSIVDAKNTGFVIATPVGLVIAAIFAAWSALDLDARRAAAVRASRAAAARRPVRGARALGNRLGRRAAAARRPAARRRTSAFELLLLAAAAAILPTPSPQSATSRSTAGAATRSRPPLRQPGCCWPRRSSRSRWRAAGDLSWWDWHLMMTGAFVLVLWAAYAGYRRQPRSRAAFGGVYLDATLEQVDERTADALRSIVTALERGSRSTRSASSCAREG